MKSAVEIRVKTSGIHESSDKWNFPKDGLDTIFLLARDGATSGRAHNAEYRD